MKSDSFLCAFSVFPLLFLQQGQYRGPEFEALAGMSSLTANSSSTGLTSTFKQRPFFDGSESEGFNRWEFWFEKNKDILIHSPKVERVLVLRSSENALLRESRVNAELVDREIFPILKQATEARDPQLLHNALQALGKTGSQEAVSILEKFLKKGDLETRCVSALALGLVEDRVALLELVNLLEAKNTPLELRAYAALGIGLRGAPETVSILKSFLSRNLNVSSAGGKTRNLMIAAIAALGMSRDPSGVSLLAEKYRALENRGRSRSSVVRATILTALGRIGDPSALSTIIPALESKNKNTDLRRAAALACGDLGDTCAVEPLAEALEKDSDDQVRGFAAISLGRIGGEKAVKALRLSFADKRAKIVKSFCAIGLGLAGDQGWADELRDLFTTQDGESLRGAAALGLGFLGDQDSVSLLLRCVKERGEPARLRGYAAIALGLIRPEGGLPQLLTALREDTERVEEFHRGLVLGIGLFQDPEAADDLIKVISEDKRPSLRGYAALALGMTRDKRAIQRLGRIIGGKAKAMPESPAFACIALGALGDRHNYPVVSEFFFNRNYRLRAEIMDQVEKYF